MMKETIKQQLLDIATETIISRSSEESLQEKIVDMEFADTHFEIIWLNKNGSYFGITYREVQDEKTKKYASLEFATMNWTKEEYENTEI